MNHINLLKGFGRHIVKFKGYFFVHLFGITLGLTAAGFSIIYIHHELTYDIMHPNADRIFRVSYQNNSGWFASLALPYADALRLGSIPEIEALVRVRRWPAKMIHVANKRVHSPKLLFTDPGSRFFDFFNFPFVEGDASVALANLNSAIITETLSRSYFGKASAIGEIIRIDTIHATVTGVIKDLPSRTHLAFDLMITNSHAMDAASAHFTYALLAPSASPEQTAAKILALPVETNWFHTPLAMRLINVKNIHFQGNMTYELKAPGNQSYLWILGSIGLIIIIIAGSNYVNLSVALYAYRSKEIAVRKAIGASATGLSHQFFFESGVIILIALLLSGTLIHLASPSFNELMGMSIQAPLSSPLTVLAIIFLGILIAGFAAIYPITVLPKIKILDLFRSSGITSHHGLLLRKLLLSVQFTILFLVCCSLWLIHSQFSFLLNKDVGFDKEGVLKLKGAWNVDSTHYWMLKDELKKNPSVLFVSEGYAPGDEDYGYRYRPMDDATVKENLLIHGTDYEYLSVLGIRVVEGPDLKNNRYSRRLCFINQTMAKSLGLECPVGEKFVQNPGEKNERIVTIDGVVADYNFKSLHSPVGPQLLWLSERSKNVDGTILVKIGTQDVQGTLEFIQSRLSQIVPEEPLTIDFLDEDLGNLYREEERLSSAVVALTAISLILSFTGLLALCSYVVEFRMKEVALRKVFGAAPGQIVALFARVFAGICLISFTIGALSSLFLMEHWMEGFAYRIDIGASPFVATFLGISGITLLLVGIQCIRAVRLNPAVVLRND